MTDARCDLTRTPWLPCRDGPRLMELGLRDVLVRAHELGGIVDPSPLVVGALHRLLIALLYDLLGGPRNVAEHGALWQAGRFEPALVEAYFAAQADRFDLFSSAYPFFQDAGFALKNADPVARLAAELASGNNVTLFDHSVDAEPAPVTPAVAARWLVAHQLYGLGGGKGPRSEKHGEHPYASHAPAAMGANVFPRGGNLFQTLVLNLRPAQQWSGLNDRGPGTTLWRRDAFPAPEKEQLPEGFLDYLTWPNRCVRLVPEAIDGEVMVRWAYTAQGRALAKDARIRDPWFAATKTRDGTPRPLRLSADRSLWRDSTVLFSSAKDADLGPYGDVPRPPVLSAVDDLLQQLDRLGERVDCLVVGIDFDQSRIDQWRAEELPLPPALLTDVQAVADLDDAVTAAEALGQNLRKALWIMATRLLEPDGARADAAQARSLMASWQAEPNYYGGLDAPFRAFLLELGEDGEAALDAWSEAILRMAQTAFEGACRQVLRDDRGLQAIAGAEHFFRAVTWPLRRQGKEVVADGS